MPYPQFALEPADPRTPPQAHTPVPEDPACQRDEISDEHRHLAYTDDLQAELERQNRVYADADSEERISVERDDDAADEPLGNQTGSETDRQLDQTTNPREAPGPGASPQGYPGR